MAKIERKPENGEMEDLERTQLVLMECAGEDAVRHEPPDVQRALDRLAEAGLLDFTTQAERVRIAELYGIRYALLRAALQADPNTKPAEVVLNWALQDHCLGTELSSGGAASVSRLTDYGDFQIMAELVHDPLADISLPADRAETLRNDASTLRKAVIELLTVIGSHLGVPEDPADMDNYQRREVVLLLRDDDQLTELVRTKARYDYSPKLLGSSANVAVWLVSQRKALY